MDDQDNDDNADPQDKAKPVVRDEAAIIRQELKEIDELPLPAHLADKPRDYFAEIVRRAAKEAISRLPEGELPSPIVLSALKAGLPETSSAEGTNGDDIPIPPTSQLHLSKVV